MVQTPFDLFSWRSQSQIACDMDKVKVSDHLDATEQVAAVRTHEIRLTFESLGPRSRRYRT
ncbi:hypothetical protein K443DRAFT_507723 [Laccaria amethystina LaAM-08-1]|uniref:Uncharacterized protein n=1 Tax=Laccaria amethystina LaAM-08-1 TaxID=1095629 RepID=A0A0C9WUE0_9AGAR|nr:hypothetical protein K443DRAFT_507723 [Laccaria amethystina LaAM-08-1]